MVEYDEVIWERVNKNGIQHDWHTAHVNLFKPNAELLTLHHQTMPNPELLMKGKGYEECRKNKKPGNSRVEIAKAWKIVEKLEQEESRCKIK